MAKLVLLVPKERRWTCRSPRADDARPARRQRRLPPQSCGQRRARRGHDHTHRFVSRGSGQHQRHAGQRQADRQALPARRRSDRHRQAQTALFCRRRRHSAVGHPQEGGPRGGRRPGRQGRNGQAYSANPAGEPRGRAAGRAEGLGAGQARGVDSKEPLAVATSRRRLAFPATAATATAPASSFCRGTRQDRPLR